MPDWQRWHRGYDDPSSSLSRRLAVVRERVAGALRDAPHDAPLRVLSLCAGDGRDLLPGLAGCRRPVGCAVLIESEPVLAEAARRSAADLGLEVVTVITGDAGEWAQLAAVGPVDLLLLCGIFGNVPDRDIQTTVAATPALLRDGGTVIWTRGGRDPDLQPTIRGWFSAAGLRETAFDGEPRGFGVGVGVKPPGVRGQPPTGPRLFGFGD